MMIIKRGTRPRQSLIHTYLNFHLKDFHIEETSCLFFKKLKQIRVYCTNTASREKSSLKYRLCKEQKKEAASV